MFGISGGEAILIAIVALLVFGPDKLPALARTAGSLFGELRRNSDKLRREFYNTVYQPANDIKKKVENIPQTIIESALREGDTPPPPKKEESSHD